MPEQNYYTGTATLNNLGPGNGGGTPYDMGTTSPGSVYALLQMVTDEMHPRVLWLDTFAPPDAVIPSFPPGVSGRSELTAHVCGVKDHLGANGLVNRKAAAVLEYGAGASLNTVYFDWRPGAYNLPPCNFVRLAVLPWGTAWAAALPRHSWRGTVVRGQFEGAMLPTVTDTVALSIGTDRLFPLPARTSAFEVQPLADAMTAYAYQDEDDYNPGVPYMQRNPLGLTYPSVSPVQVHTSNVLAVGALGVSGSALLRFWLAL